MNTCDMPRETVDRHCRECGWYMGPEMVCTRCAKAKKAEEVRQAQYADKRCCECRASEHEDFDPVVGLCTVKDPDTKKIVQRGYICESHVQIRVGDGYDVYLNGRRID